MLLGSPDEEKGNDFGLNTGCSKWVESVAKAYSGFEMLVGCLREILFQAHWLMSG